MNKCLAMLATVIVTSSLGHSEIHAQNYNIGQATQIKDTTTVSSIAATSHVPSVSGTAINIKPLFAASELISTLNSLTSASGAALEIQPFTPTFETTLELQPITPTFEAALELQSPTPISGTALQAPNIMPKCNTKQNKNILTPLKKSKKKALPKKIKKKKIKYKKMEVPKHNNFKSYMGYQSITCKASKQYKLQQKAKTGKFGIRMVNDRYLIALGTYYTKNVGDKFDIKLSDGTIIKCMIGDIKSDMHTDAKRQKQRYDGSILEFITDPDKMPHDVKRAGSYTACKKFSGSIKEIRKLK